MEGVALRYWSNYHKAMVEHLVDIKHGKDRSAKGLIHNICMKDGLVSCTIDGACVVEKVSQLINKSYIIPFKMTTRYV